MCAIYGDYLGIKGRCIGHGCLPYEMPEILPNGVPVERVDRRKQASGRGTHGFALLTLKGGNLKAEYIHQDRVTAKSESLS